VRLIYWILGAAASSIAGAAVLARQRERKIAADFLAAVREGRIEEIVDKPTVDAAGRGGVIVGLADGSAFELTMRADRHGVARAFVLHWLGRDRVSGTHHVLKGGAHVAALAEAYERLAKLCSHAQAPKN
jgi:hypothetical protein